MFAISVAIHEESHFTAAGFLIRGATQFLDCSKIVLQARRLAWRIQDPTPHISGFNCEAEKARPAQVLTVPKQPLRSSTLRVLQTTCACQIHEREANTWCLHAGVAVRVGLL